MRLADYGTGSFCASSYMEPLQKQPTEPSQKTLAKEQQDLCFAQCISEKHHSTDLMFGTSEELFVDC